MVKGKPIRMEEIMAYIQKKMDWEGGDSSGQGIISFTEFQNMMVFEMNLTADMRKIKDVWAFLKTSPATKSYNKKKDKIVIEICKFNALLDKMNSTGTKMASPEDES